MQTQQFDFQLPECLIAKHPLADRSGSRLCVVSRSEDTLTHRQFIALPELLSPGDLLVFNDTKVIPARLYARKMTGGQCELLVERIQADQQVLAHVRASKAPQVGSTLCLLAEEKTIIQVMGRQDDLYVLKFLLDEPVLDLLYRVGEVPLPPYLNRTPDEQDIHRYQTLFAKHPGAVAAPTAALHFDEKILQHIDDRDIQRAMITLHVGAGTFQPVRVHDIRDHRMHAEYLEVSDDTVQRILATKAAGKRVIAVGTTVVRALETAAKSGQLSSFVGDSDIFIYPGYSFNVIDGLLTNFHLPKSTLLMLVCAFAGYDNIMAAYQQAIEQQYRFFSYGDAMLVL